MAKKVTTPPPPRRPVQAPKVRTGGRGAGGDTGDRRRLTLVIGAVAAVALVGAALAFFALRGDDDTGPRAVAEKMRAAGCTMKSVPASKANLHLASLDQKVPKPWNTFPPTSGYHYQSPAIWEFYEDPVDPKQVVHNQEHGGMTIWFGQRVSESVKQQLRDFYNESPNAVIGTPHPRLGNKIALTAWTRKAADGGVGPVDQGHVATCTKFDEPAFIAFRDTYRGKGPERFPIDLNRPGS